MAMPIVVTELWEFALIPRVAVPAGYAEINGNIKAKPSRSVDFRRKLMTTMKHNKPLKYVPAFGLHRTR